MSINSWFCYNLVVAERLFFVEGPSGSGKNTLLKKLEKKFGYPNLRGMISQYPEENKRLEPKAQQLIAGLELDLGLALDFSLEEGTRLANVCSEIAIIQYLAARSTMEKMQTATFLNRSIITELALIRLVGWRALNELADGEEIAKWSHLTYERVLEKVYKYSITGINGIIYLTEPVKVGAKENTLLRGYQERESLFISKAIKDIAQCSSQFKIPVLTANPNHFNFEGGLDEGLKLVNGFVNAN
jgi:hypothetical protein